MNQLNYYSHIVLNSKYKIFINLFVYIIIYMFITNSQVVYCMTEDTGLIADAKSSARPIPGPNTKSIVQREIEQFINMASVVDEKNDIIVAKDRTILAQNNELKQKNELIASLQTEVTKLRNAVNGFDIKENPLSNTYVHKDGLLAKNSRLEYENKYTSESLLRLQAQHTKLQNQCTIAEKLLAEAQVDKSRLYNLLERRLGK